MKALKFLSIISLLIITSCASVSVNTDYDKNVDFSQFKTFAYYKQGIDKVKISDFDKKRILRSIDSVMISKGYTKSETPDLLVNFYTDAEKNVTTNQYYPGWGYYGWGYGWGYGWNPYWYGNTYTTTSTSGILTIDLIDFKKNELVWEGVGVGYLTQNRNKKDAVINGFVSSILTQYPPEPKKQKTKNPQ